MKPLMETRLKNIRFKNPVLVASGTFGYAREFEEFLDLKRLGGIVTKTITLKPRLGNPPPRVCETPSGMLNAIGLQNVGAEAFVRDKLPYLRKIGVPILVSVMGYSVEEFKAVVSILEKKGGFDGYELNLSCPNVSYKNRSGATRVFAHDPVMVRQVVGIVRKLTRRPMAAKLSPEVTDIRVVARAAEGAGADAVSVVNTFLGMAIDVETRRPSLANVTGGLSGPCIRPIAVRIVRDVYGAVKIPVIGMGGIASWRDAAEFIIAGASLVQVGTANFANPGVTAETIKGLEDYLRRKKIVSAKELVGSLSAGSDSVNGSQDLLRGVGAPDPIRSTKTKAATSLSRQTSRRIKLAPWRQRRRTGSGRNG